MVQQAQQVCSTAISTQSDSNHSLLQQTRQLFGDPKSNDELMAQIMSAIRALHQLNAK